MEKITSRIRNYAAWPQVILILMLVVGIAALIANKGFRLSYYQEHWRIQLPDAAAVELASRYATSLSLAAIDRESNYIQLQQVSRQDAEQIVSQLQSQLTDQTVLLTRVFPQVGNLVIWRVFAAAALAALVFLGFVYITLRPRVRDWQAFRRYQYKFLLTVFVSFVMVLGLFSLISVVYNLDLSTLGILVLAAGWLVWGTFLALPNVVIQKGEKAIWQAHSQAWLQYSRQTRVLMLLLVLGVGLILGNTFVLDSVLLIFAITLAGYMQVHFYPVLSYLSTVKIRLPRFILSRK